MGQVLTRAKQPLAPPGGIWGNHSLVTLTDQPEKTYQTSHQAFPVFPTSRKWVLSQGSIHEAHGWQSPDRLTHSQQAPLLPTWHLKQGLGEGFKSQDPLRDGPHLRGFGSKLDGAGDGGELAGARNDV